MTIAPEHTDLTALLRAAVDGEVDDSARRRAEYSTDASNYRVPPQVVVFPRDASDLLAALEAARVARAPVTMRGGGTSVAGNSIGPSVVIDTSRYMNRVLSIDTEARTARVQPGLVLSELQKAAAPQGLRFGPDPSTTTRATLGGLIGNNACGPHAVAYGKTSDNVIELDAVLGSGQRITAQRKGVDTVPGLKDLVNANLSLIRTEFGRFDRQVSGYSLQHLLPELGGDLAKFLVGTEGTLATTLEATVALVPIAPVRITAAFGYDDMPAAADAVMPIMAHKPHAVEGLDARLIDRIRAAKGDQAIPALPPGAGWLFVEVGADTEDQAQEILAAIKADAGTSSVAVFTDAGEAARLWAIRADGAGLAGRSVDNKECWPGWEDAAVPPERLGQYLRDFDELMARHEVTGQPFGHFGDGCIHVRLDIPLQDSGQPLRAFMEDAAALVTSHGGSLSGEHGDGRARGELLHHMYSPEALALFGQVKALFDPAGHLNPGIMVDPAPLDQDLRRPTAPRTPATDGFAFAHDHGDLSEALHRCTGVGKCRADAIGSGSGFMCPSYQATKDEKDVTRGRARVLQEAINGQLIGGLAAPEVRESLDLCLSCKACSSDCPSGIDMAAYKSEALHRTYQGKLRPVTHYSIGWLPRWLKVVGVAPRLINAILKPRWIQRLAVSTAGMDSRRHLPTFATTPFRKSAAAKARRASARSSSTRAESATERRVVLWADSFTDGLDAQVPEAIVTVLEDAGFEVVIPDQSACCGVTWISTGQLDGARKQLTRLLEVLGPVAVNSIPIIGIEPSCTAVLRGDLVELLPNDPRAHAVANGIYTLAEVLTGRAPVKPRATWELPRLDDVTAVVQPHCHQYSVTGFTADRELLKAAGATITETSGCCGLAGNWGTEKGHYDTSVAVAENSLLPALRSAPEDAIYLADGVSCRTQAEDLHGTRGMHVAELLAQRVERRTAGAGE
ncbi:FAD-binding oxidoreductase [Demequina sp. B12]|uniref:FAD-binding and (Fe-S)-binding domain-containing protein n=1 Tax=Demequina sp. B12 TaxID=2992757 RepID=UPI00237BF069|nr:FAD-binding and (Fe-S)-binding domain-containing protein [Demequina sp. B12]MDE0573639.1 FAD-binding oxidoreductase [Demequina sp. B12]